ncbi:MAG: GNAT family N-acetyltransferase [Bacillota bacterium]|nr:GNAT family N-acetyltransferase [Bacillota bacterium]
MNLKKLDQENLDLVIEKYIEYYNEVEAGKWTYDLVHKRINQIITMADSLAYVFYKDKLALGFVIGYYMVYDDLKGLFIEDILIFKDYQNKGYGKIFMEKIFDLAKDQGASMVELISEKDQGHIKFYKDLDFYPVDSLVIMAKDLD